MKNLVQKFRQGATKVISTLKSVQTWNQFEYAIVLRNNYLRLCDNDLRLLRHYIYLRPWLFYRYRELKQEFEFLKEDLDDIFNPFMERYKAKTAEDERYMNEQRDINYQVRLKDALAPKFPKKFKVVGFQIPKKRKRKK